MLNMSQDHNNIINILELFGAGFTQADELGNRHDHEFIYGHDALVSGNDLIVAKFQHQG